MFNQTNLSRMAGAATFAATFMFMLAGQMRRFMRQRMARLAGVALLAPLLMLGLAPAATFAAPVRPDEGTSARVVVALGYEGAATLLPGDAFTYTVTVTNGGPGVAEQTRVDLPLDVNVMVDDFKADNANVYVETLNPDMISIQFHDIAPGTSSAGTIMAHVKADAPAALTLNSRATVNWNDRYPNRISESNDVAVLVGTGAPPAPTKPLTVDLGSPVDAGTALTVSGAFYDADEMVSMWLNAPDGVTIPAESLGQTDSTMSGSAVGLDAVGLADDSGLLTYVLDTTGLPSGTYSLVAHGNTSGLEGVVSFTIK